MENEFDIQEYLEVGVESILKDAVRVSLKNPKESLFLLKFSRKAKKATEIRKNSNQNIPVFLIASITSRCNLNCSGCYSMANNSDDECLTPLTCEEWDDIFNEAKDIGISFIVLAGGEPLIRKDVIVKASNHPEILFPVFTNGTMLDNDYLKLFDDHRNLVPVFSIEGDEETTDSRRGKGVYSKLIESMEIMGKKNIIFGTSLTFTRKNLSSLLSNEFIDKLRDLGCKVVFFIEYVPVNGESNDMAPGDEERELLLNELNRLRNDYLDMIFLSFPGDEKTSGGCLAAGRGFFHINPYGAAEPCPASPYSDINVRDNSLLEALNSKLFKSLRDDGILLDDHDGGCVLFEHKEDVEKLLNE